MKVYVATEVDYDYSSPFLVCRTLEAAKAACEQQFKRPLKRQPAWGKYADGDWCWSRNGRNFVVHAVEMHDDG